MPALLLLRCRTCHSPLLNRINSLQYIPPTVQIPLNGSTSIWSVIHSSSFCKICTLDEVSLCPIVQVISKTLNSMGFSVGLWSTPLEFSLQRDILSRTRVLWAQQLSLFSISLPFIICLSGSYWRQWQQSYWSQDKQHPPLCPYPLVTLS